MTDEELKNTEVYKLAVKVTNEIWLQDGEKIKKDASVWLKTHEIYSACWKRFKECIPYMESPDFWLYPDGFVDAAGARKSDDPNLEWILEIDIPFGEATPSYGTISKLLINYSHILDKVWKDHYCKIVTEKLHKA